MKLLFTSVFSIVMLSSFAQGVEYDKKTGVVTNGKETIFTMEAIKSPTNYGFKDYSIKAMDGKEYIFVKIDEFNDPAEVSSASPDGRTIYYQLNFIGMNVTAEINFHINPKKIAEAIYNAKLLKADGLDDAAVERFVLSNGNRFTRRRNEINQKNTTIIINNTQPTPPAPGINIGIGR